MSNKDRILLILDIDETLIYASENPLAQPADFRAGPYWVYQRPGLSGFLTQVSCWYDIAFWSSATLSYVQAVVQQILPPTVKPVVVWGRSRCVHRYDMEYQEEYYVKDLRKLARQGYPLERILIVDNTPRKVERQYGNAIYVRSFYGSTADDELDRLAGYLQSLSQVENVRHIEKRGWQQRPE